MNSLYRSFIIKADGRFLRRNINAFYSLDYTNYGQPGNPDFIVDFKDDKSQYDFNSYVIQNACNNGRDYVYGILKTLYYKWTKNFVVCVVPRAKPNKSTHFRDFICDTLNRLWHETVFESEAEAILSSATSNYITRISPTRTTHFPTSDGGESPYPGITKDTCAIFEKGIRGKNVLLIDDIYTHHHRNPQTGEKEIVGVDEDCLQALLDCGAKNVVFYALARTIK